MKDENEEAIAAEAMLVSIDPVTTSRERYLNLRPEREKIAKATAILEELGFTIEAEGVVSLSLSGKKETYERTFGVGLQKQSHSPGSLNDTNNTALHYWVPLGKPRIPDILKNLVYDVQFPVPPTPFG